MAERRTAERRNGRIKMAEFQMPDITAAEWVELLQQVISTTYLTECWQIFRDSSKTV